jgi:hypothetical protein
MYKPRQNIVYIYGCFSRLCPIGYFQVFKPTNPSVIPF